MIEVFELGNEATVDESLLAYTGKDMRVQAIDKYYPDKPHDYGLVNYLLTTKLLHSSHIIVTELQSRLPGEKDAPQAAMLKMIDRLLPHVDHLHVTADSGFSPLDSPLQLKGRKRSCTIAFKKSASAELAALHTVGTAALAQQHGRTYSDGDRVVQFRNNLEYITSVISSAYVIQDAARVRPELIGSYEDAQRMRENYSAAALKALCRLPDDAPMGDVPACSRWQGRNVLLPPPTKPGELQEDVPITVDTLNAMPKGALQVLAQRTAGASGSASKKKKIIIDSILKHHHRALEAADAPVAPAADDRHLDALRSLITGPSTADLQVCSHFSERYGFVDQFDKVLYSIYHIQDMRAWVKVFVGSYLYMLVFNSWAAYDEHVAEREYAVQGRRLSAGMDANRSTIVSFIITLARQILAEKSAE